jgi:hypothetical protein
MLDKITILGEYLANDPQGTWIGGKEFKKGRIVEANVNEDTFLNLLIAQENKWFSIKSHNYDEFKLSRGRWTPEQIKAIPAVIQAVAEPIVQTVSEPIVQIVAEPIVQTVEEAIVQTVVEPIVVEPAVVEPTEEVAGEVVEKRRRR